MTQPQPYPAPGMPPGYNPAYRVQPAMRMTRKVGAPLAALIVIGLLAGLVMALAGLVNPLLFAFGLVPTLIFFAGAVLAYLWLDRWEPEPLRLLLFAFLWGAGVAVVGALVVGTVLSIVGLSDPVIDTVVQAPVVEEALKGALLLVMLTGRRRAEMNSLTDFLVYAGMVGLGFAFVEDLLYISSSESLGGALLTAALRLIMGVFAHPFFTSATAIGLYLATQARGAGLKALYGIGGYVVAVALHAIWNGSSLAGGLTGYLIAYALVLAPLFAGLVYLAVRTRNAEGRTVARQIPRMMAEGLLMPEEASWLTGLGTRRTRLQSVKGVAGSDAAKQARHFTDVVTELAFVRDRIDAGRGTPETARTEAELVEAVRVERALALPGLVKAWQAGHAVPEPVIPAAGATPPWPSAQPPQPWPSAQPPQPWPSAQPPQPWPPAQPPQQQGGGDAPGPRIPGSP
ncbi:PrsW family intramembrane metalloprotease [Propionicicella superfundia]|uniref:PrsW family intramembrane metalloprotease n=1 Tax=Propionicicella superfundia TaxID=348582 RepID=UPI0004172927|nr:PrsW family intramembrane metalloprotease [Propionicicella superfundia]